MTSGRSQPPAPGSVQAQLWLRSAQPPARPRGGGTAAAGPSAPSSGQEPVTGCGWRYPFQGRARKRHRAGAGEKAKSRRAQSWGRAQRWRGGLQKKPRSGCCALPPCRRRASGRNPSQAGLERGQGAGTCRCVGLPGSGGTGRSPPGAVPQPQVLHEILALQAPMAAAASWQRYGGGTAWCCPQSKPQEQGEGITGAKSCTTDRAPARASPAGPCQAPPGTAPGPFGAVPAAWPLRIPAEGPQTQTHRSGSWG